MRLLSAILIALSLNGCLYQRYQTESSRSATEQLLITLAVQDAVQALELPDVAGKQVAVETASIAGDDANYLQAEVEARLRKAGANVVPAAAADWVYVAMVDAVGTVSRDLVFGIPAVPIAPGVSSPAFPIVRVIKQRGYSGLRLVAHDRGGAFVMETAPTLKRRHFEIYGFFFVALRRNDIYPGENFELALD